MLLKFGSILTMSSKPIWLYLTVALWSGIVSWAVAHWTLSKQNRLSDKRNLIELIEDVESVSVSYWLSSGQKRITEVTLTGKLKKINQEIQSLYNVKSSLYKQLERENINFRKEITGGGFESKKRLEEQGRATNIQDISCQFIALIKGNT